MLDDLLADIVLSRLQFDDMPVGSDHARTVREAPLHVVADFQVSEQEEFQVVAGLRRVERRAQRLTRSGWTGEMRRQATRVDLSM